MSGYAFALVLSAVSLTFVFSLLRARRIREKYAGIWLVVGLAIIVLAVFPSLAVDLARLVGVETPSNLLFAASLVVLLLVSVQLSSELSSLEEETRTLAERVALLGYAVEHREDTAGGPADETDLGPTA